MKAAPPSTPRPPWYPAQASAATADAGVNRDSGSRVVPLAMFVVTRPPGTNREIMMTRPARRSSCRPQASAAALIRGNRPSSRGPNALRLSP